MKSIILILGLFTSIQLAAQSTIQTSTIAVKGNCDECKERIENSVDIKGVKDATWNEETQAITITFDTKKVSLEQIETAIAKSGHKTANKEADLKAYNGLPDCCKYESKHCEKK